MTAFRTSDRKIDGTPRSPSLLLSSPTSRWLTTAPRIATARTPPSWRLVLMVDAAIPDRSAGTIESTAAVTATSASPSPNPTTASAAASGPTETSGASSALTPSMPPPASRHPPHMGRRGPRVRGPHAGDTPGDHHRDRHGDELERDLPPREVRDDLQVERGEEEDGEQAEARHERDGGRAGEHPVAEELEPQDGIARAQLDPDERRAGGRGDDEQRDDPPGAEAGALRPRSRRR